MFMLLNIYTKNASNLTNKYRDVVLQSQNYIPPTMSGENYLGCKEFGIKRSLVQTGKHPDMTEKLVIGSRSSTLNKEY